MTTTINLDMSWAKLFSVQCNHAYFLEGICRDIEFVPTEETALALRNYQLIFRPSNGGFTVLRSNSLPGKQPLLQAGKDLKFTFLIKSTDFRFWHYSNLPFISEYSAFYFSNQVNLAGKQTEKLLHATKLSDDHEIVALRPKRFSLHFDAPISGGDIEVQGGSGQKIDWFAGDTKEKRTQFLLNLAAYPSGKFQINVKGKPYLQFYMLDKITPVMGLLDIFIGAAAESHKFVQKGSFVDQAYSLRIENRATYWKYFLLPIGKNELDIKEVQVLLDGEKIPFTKPEPVTVGNGVKALMIQSETPIELKEAYSDSEKLEFKFRKGDKWMNKPVKIEKPGVDMVKPDRQSKKVYSTVYAYI